ncbi:hypothetical protein BZA77DRAFT_343231 [Pyronema omphalodes]|nr:hypothetical protein BZA77DRAFT_343231 [Pyronema omphalodes]
MSDQPNQLQKRDGLDTTILSSQSSGGSSTYMQAPKRTNMDLFTDGKNFHFHFCTHGLFFDVCFEVENYSINPNLEITKAMQKYDRNYSSGDALNSLNQKAREMAGQYATSLISESGAEEALTRTDRIPIQIYLQEDGTEIVRPHRGWSRKVAKLPAGSWNFKGEHITIKELRELCTDERALTSGSVVKIAKIKYHMKQAQGLQTLFLKRNVEDLLKLQESGRPDLFPKIYAVILDDEGYETGLLRHYIPGTLLDEENCPEYNETEAEKIVSEVNAANNAMLKSGVHWKASRHGIVINKEDGTIKISIIGIGGDDPDSQMDEKAEAQNAIEMAVLIREIRDSAKREI